MAELPIHPQSPHGEQSPSVALENRRKALADRPRERYATLVDELRRRAAVETLLLTGDPAQAEDDALVERQLTALRQLETAAVETKEPSLAHIRAIHRQANPSADGEWRRLEQPGQFKAARPSHPAHIEAKLDNLNHWLSSETGRQMFASERMALWFARFLEIAPFERGNFRTAHLFLTFFAAADGFPPVALARADADGVREELERAMAFDTAPLVKRLSDALARSLSSCEDGFDGDRVTGPRAEPILDYYAVLGVSPDASPAELKRAYRALVKEVHPDSGDAGDAERFRSVREAYETLSDPGRRRRYDRERAPVPWTGGVTEIVGHGRAPFRPADSRPVHLDIVLSRAEAARGGDVSLEVPVRGPCRSCRGTGRDFYGLCRSCGGVGALRHYARVRFRVPPGVADGARLRSSGGDAVELTARVKISR